jgi:hypothetical protein
MSADAPNAPKSSPPSEAAEKLAALNERLKGAAVLSLLNIKSKPAPDALMQQFTQLREVVFGLCAHLPADDPNRATAIERLKAVEALMQDPLEWHILSRAQELRQDATDPKLRAQLEATFYEENVPRTVWQSMPLEGQSELRKSLRLPMLIDVELDIGGKKTRCQMQNLSRDGVCLEVPADFSASHLDFTVWMPNASPRQTSPGQIVLHGDVVWREKGRVGVAFKLSVSEQNALDAALLQHFAALQRTCERWCAVAPRSGAAIACSAIVGYASSALPSSRKEHLDRLAAAAEADRASKDLQFALAKLRIEEKDYEGAAVALKRVVVNDRADPRYRLLELTLAQRWGKPLGQGKIGAALGAAKLPVAAVVFIGLCAAGSYAFFMLRSPYEKATVPFGGLACESIKMLQSNAGCYVNAAAYRAMDQKQRALLAEKTLEGLAGKGVKMVTVMGNAGEGVLEVFKPNTIAVLKQDAPKAPPAP